MSGGDYTGNPYKKYFRRVQKKKPQSMMDRGFGVFLGLYSFWEGLSMPEMKNRV